MRGLIFAFFLLLSFSSGANGLNEPLTDVEKQAAFKSLVEFDDDNQRRIEAAKNAPLSPEDCNAWPQEHVKNCQKQEADKQAMRHALINFDGRYEVKLFYENDRPFKGTYYGYSGWTDLPRDNLGAIKTSVFAHYLGPTHNIFSPSLSSLFEETIGIVVSVKLDELQFLLSDPRIVGVFHSGNMLPDAEASKFAIPEENNR